MGLIAKNKGEGIELLRADTHHGICYSVVDIGTQPSNNPKFRPKHQVVISWEIPHERIVLEQENGPPKNLPRAISRTLTLSLSTKSNMRPMLEAWRGRAFTEQELEGFDLQKLLGANALIGVIHETRGEKTYANISSVSKLMATIKPLKGELPQVFFSMEEIKGKYSVPPQIPDWIKAKIMQSDEWMARMQGSEGGQPDAGRDDQAHPEEQPDEDVPF